MFPNSLNPDVITNNLIGLKKNNGNGRFCGMPQSTITFFPIDFRLYEVWGLFFHQRVAKGITF